MAQTALPIRKYIGFSLVEIVITMFIVSVLVSMAALAFRGSVNRSHLQNAADRFSADLCLVRDQARRDQKSYTLLIIPAILTYRAPGVSMLHSPADIAVCLAESPYKITELSLAGIQGATTITFDSHGRANPAGTIDLILGTQKIGIQISEGGKVEQIH